jgi:hypothetical protein
MSPPLFRFTVVRQRSSKCIAKIERVSQVHPILSFDNLTALDLVLDKIQEASLYLMYDMRGLVHNIKAYSTGIPF